MKADAKSAAGVLDRRQAVARLLTGRAGTVVVSGLGAPTYDVAAAGDHERNFYLWGAMGGAVMIGLGLALARPDDPVAVVTGDGEIIMGLGSLAPVGRMAPANLSIVVLDNGSYGETGGQPTHTATNLDLCVAAAAAGIGNCVSIRTFDELDAFAPLLHDAKGGPALAVVAISNAEHDKVIPVRDGAVNRARLREALGVPEG